MYQVIHFFTDLQDFNHPYHEGDAFPRDGMKVSENRLKELSGKDNRQRKPLIKKVDEKVYTKTDIHRMSVDNLRSLAVEQGIEDADEMNGSDIKKLLIERMGL